MHYGAANHSPFPRFQEPIVGNLNMISFRVTQMSLCCMQQRKYSQTLLIWILGAGEVSLSWEWVMLLKSKIQVLFEKNTEEIKEDISIVKLNISILHKAVITLTRMMPE